ncbi:unnamed protein product, partial [Mesorhabditis belari]|uniref:Protein kinase domain-containing protein n=1 Tax=Mesorhabditis belari TaxID=2138241 RepID=A0AAF3JC48_9BILA
MEAKKFGSTRIVLNRILDILGVPDDYYYSIFGKELRCVKRPNKLTEELERLCKKSSLQYVNVVDVGLLDVEDFCDLLQKMLNPDQKVRPSAEECLEHPFLQGLNKRLQTHALNRQPVTDEEMKDRNQKHKELLNKQLLSGYTRLSF